MCRPVYKGYRKLAGRINTPHPASRTPHPASLNPHPAPRIPHPAPRTPHPAPSGYALRRSSFL